MTEREWGVVERKTGARTVMQRDGKLAVGKVGEGWVLWGYRSRAWV